MHLPLLDIGEAFDGVFETLLLMCTPVILVVYYILYRITRSDFKASLWSSVACVVLIIGMALCLSNSMLFILLPLPFAVNGLCLYIRLVVKYW
jgi:hypothetical protein